MWQGKTPIHQVLIAAALLALLILISPLLPIATGAPAMRQAPGDDRPTLEATRMPLTVLPVQTVRTGLTTTAAAPAATATLTPTVTATIHTTTPLPTMTALKPTSTQRTPTPVISAVPTLTTVSDSVVRTPGHYVTHLPPRQVPQQHLPTASDGPTSTHAPLSLVLVALLCCAGGWLLIAIARR
jgi:hypothetical protein